MCALQLHRRGEMRFPSLVHCVNSSENNGKPNNWSMCVQWQSAPRRRNEAASARFDNIPYGLPSTNIIHTRAHYIHHTQAPTLLCVCVCAVNAHILCTSGGRTERYNCVANTGRQVHMAEAQARMSQIFAHASDCVRVCRFCHNEHPDHMCAFVRI